MRSVNTFIHRAVSAFLSCLFLCSAFVFAEGGSVPQQVQDWQKAAAELVESENLTGAAAEYQKIIAAFPASGHALNAQTAVALMYIRAGDTQQASAAMATLHGYKGQKDFVECVKQVQEAYLSYPDENRFVYSVTVQQVSGPWYVKPDGSDANDGRSWESAFGTIQTAIDSASDNDEILIKSGTAEYPVIYYEQLDLKGKTLTIHSDDPNNWQAVEHTIIDAGLRGTAVLYRGNESGQLKGFTITGGAPAGDGLAVRLTLDDGTGLVAADSSGKGRNGSLVFTGDPVWATGRIDGVLEFDGNDYIEIDGYKGITGGNSRTCIAWIKTTMPGEIVSWGDTSEGHKWIVRVSETGALRAEISNGYIYGTTVINDGRWHHVAVVLEDDGSPDISEARLYVDGRLDTVSTDTLACPVNSSDAQNVSIGVFKMVGVRYFQGLMDDVRIYSRALSADEIDEMAGPRVPAVFIPLDSDAGDISGNGYHGVGQGSPTYSDGVIVLDGVDDYVSLPAGIINPAAGPFSAFARVRGGASNVGIISQVDDVTGAGRYWLGISNGELWTALRTSGQWGLSYTGSSWDSMDWHHVGVVWDGNRRHLYLDGVEVAADAGSIGSLEACTGALYIGTNKLTTPGYFWPGEIDDVQIFTRALTAAEVAELPGRECLQGHWTLDGNLNDSSTNDPHSGVWHGTSGYGEGYYGQAAALDGSRYIEITGYNGVSGSQARTSAAWIHIGDLTSTGTILSWGANYSGNGNKWWFRVEKSASSNCYRLGLGTWGGYYVCSDYILNPSQWHHVAASLNGATLHDIKLYVDGDEVPNYTRTTNIALQTDDEEPVHIGASCAEGIMSSYFKGRIDDVRIYSRALTISELRELADAAPRLAAHWKLDVDFNDSVTGQNGDGINSPDWIEGISGRAAGLDGVNQYVRIPHHPQLKPQLPLTLSAWIYLQESGTSGLIVQTDDWNTTYSGAYLRLKSDGSDKIALGYGDGGPNSWVSLRNKIGTTVLQPGRWYYVVGVICGPEDMSIYINGIDDGGTCGGVGSGVLHYTEHDIMIGSQDGLDAFFKGGIDDVRICNYALDRGQIQSLYQTRFADGGGIRGQGASSDIEKCIIKDNTSQTNGGGVSSIDGVLLNCLFIQNTSEGFGGAVSDSGAEIRNCTVVNNAAVSGGALYSCSGQILNAIVWGNTPNPLVNSSSVSFSCVQDWTQGGTGNISANPLFRNPAEKNYRLLLSSPCIDAGNPASVFSSEPSPNGGRVNLGAYGNTADAATTEEGRENWDTDDDGIPDRWEVENGLNPLDDTDASENNDADEFSNLCEYLHGTNPNAHDDSMPPSTIYVRPDALTIQQAIDHSFNGDTVVVASGIYTGQGNRDIDFRGKAITVRSADGPDTCIIDCQGTAEEPHRGFYFHSSEGNASVLSGFTIRNGYAPDEPWGLTLYYSTGGAIFIHGTPQNYCSPTIRDCIIKDNFSAFWGGGLNGRNSNAVIEECTFLNNRAADTGGGVYMIVSDYTIRNCHFIENEAVGGSGGALWAQGSISTIENCIIERNRAKRNGGGFKFHSDPYALPGQTATISGCKFYGNVTETFEMGIQGGGALDFSLPTAEVVNSIFAGNVSSNLGGAIRSREGTAIIAVNCSFSDNIAVKGSSISVVGNEQYSADAELYNSIIWHANCSAMPEISVEYGSVGVSDCDIIGGENSVFLSDPNSAYLSWSNETNISRDPLFARKPTFGPDALWGTADDDYGDLHLYNTCSPCINAGDDSWVSADITGDIDGNPRFVSSGFQPLVVLPPVSIVDIGAYEFQDFDRHQPPYAADDPGACEDPIPCPAAPVIIYVLENDCDPDGDRLAVDPNLQSPAHGTAQVSSDRLRVTYTPDAAFSGIDSFRYQVSDGNSLSNWAIVTIAVQSPAEHDPVAVPDAAVAGRGTPIIIDVLENDFDPDQDAITVKDILSGPSKGTAEITQDGKIRYTSYSADGEEESFTYRIEDSTGRMAQATVTVRILAVDAGPNQTIRLPNNQVILKAEVYGAAANAAVSWETIDRPVGAAVTFGSLISPDTAAVFSLPGTYILQIELNSDGLSVKDSAVITVQPNSTGGNRPPQVQVWAEPDTMTLPDNTTTLNWRISDDGVSKGGLSQFWEVVNGPITGDVSFGACTPQSRTTQASFSADGVYILRLTVSDGIDSAKTLLMIQVNPDSQTNAVPIVDAGPNRQISLFTGPQSITLNDPEIKAYDPDDRPGPLTVHWQILNNSSGIAFASESNILYPTLTVTTPGRYIVQLKASDGLATVTDTMLISTSSVRVDAGPDEVVVLPDEGQVTHTLSGWCESEPAGLFSSTEWQVVVQPEQSGVQFDPILPALSVWNPAVTFSKPGDYVFRLTAKDTQGAEVGSDEVYLKVKPASEVFTTYLYLYDLSDEGKTKWCEDYGKPTCPPANLVFSSYTDGTKLAWQKVDPNGIAFQMKDVNPVDPNDPNLVNISDANPMVKGQYVYVDGEDSVYKVTSGNNKFSILAGDLKRDSVSGYFVMSKNGLGVDTEFYSHIGKKAWNGRRLVVFAYQDDTHVTIRWDSDKDDVCDENEDIYLVMQGYDLQTNTSSDVVMNNALLNAGDHVYRLPGDDNIYIHVTSDKPVSVEMCNDSGFYVPSSDGRWTGLDFSVYADSIMFTTRYSGIREGTSLLGVYAYEDNTEVIIKNSAFDDERSLLWSGVLHEGQGFDLPEQTLLCQGDDYDENIIESILNSWDDEEIEETTPQVEKKAYMNVHSDKPVAVTVRPAVDMIGGYAHGDFVPDKKGTGAGIDLIGYCVSKTILVYNENNNLVPEDSNRYFTILAHNEDTQFSIYNSQTWEPVDFNPDPNEVEIVKYLHEGQHFKAEKYLGDGDKCWRVVSTKPVTVSTGANRAFAEYAPLAGIQSPTPEIEMAARTGKGYPELTNDPNVYPLIPGLDEITYIITYWNPSGNPTVYGQKIVDELPAQADRNTVQFTGINGAYDVDTNTITWDIGTLASGSDPMQVAVTIRINQYPKNSNKIVNRARIENVDSLNATLPVIVQVDMTRLPAIGDIVYVNSHAAGLNNGSSWKDAFNDLQEALQAAPISGASQIWVAAGIYSPGPKADSSFQMEDGIDMYGGFSGNENSFSERDLKNPDNQTILAGFTGNQFVVTAATAALDGFTIREAGWGRTVEWFVHAGIYCNHESPKIRNCIIEYNRGFPKCQPENGPVGYGIYCCDYASPVIENTIVRGNIVGIYFDDKSNAAILNSNIVRNTIGIDFYKSYGQTVIRNNTIVNNGLFSVRNYFVGGAIDISNCIIWGKGDFDPNGLCITDEDTITHCCLSNPKLADRTIIDPNFAESGSLSHSIFENYYLYSEKTVAASDANCINVEDGTRYRLNEMIEIEDDGVLRTITGIIEGDDCDVVLFDPVRQRSIASGTIVYKWGADAINADEDYHIKGDSRCVDAGLPISQPGELDIDGQSRVMGYVVDIGADEYTQDNYYTYRLFAGSDKTADPGESVLMSDATVLDSEGQPVSIHDIPSLKVRWAVVSKPSGSSMILESPDDITLHTEIVPDITGTYVLQVFLYDDDQCIGADVVVITVRIFVEIDPVSDVMLVYDSSTGEIKTSVALCGHVRGVNPAAAQIIWTVPDNVPIVLGAASLTEAQGTCHSTLPVTFYMPGRYQIQLAVLSVQGYSLAEYSIFIVVHDLPYQSDAGQDITRSWQGTNIVIPLSGRLLPRSIPGESYLWHYVQGPSGGLQLETSTGPSDVESDLRNPAATFSKPGIYRLQFAVTHPSIGCVVDDLTVTIDSKEIPLTVYAGANLYGILINGTATVQARQSFVCPTDNVTLQWYDQNNDPIAGATAIDSTFTFTQSDDYEYTVRATRDGVTVSDKIKIRIYPQLTNNLLIQTGEYGPILAGEVFSLEEAFVWFDGPAMLSYEWSSDDEANVLFSDSRDNGRTSNILWPNVKFAGGVAKLYTLTLTVKNGDSVIGSASVSIRAVTQITPPADTEAPLLSITHTLLDEYGDESPWPGPEAAIEKGYVSLGIYVLDTPSGICTITVHDSCGGSAPVKVQENAFSKTTKQTWISCELNVLNLATGVHTITVTATDHSSNTKTDNSVAFRVARRVPNQTEKPYAMISNLDVHTRDYGKFGTQSILNEVTEGLFPIRGLACHPIDTQEIQFKFELYDPAALVYPQLGTWSLLDGKYPPNPDYFVQRLAVYDASESQGTEGYYAGPIGEVSDVAEPAVFGRLDLTGANNGTYALLLTVRSRPDDQTAYNYSYAVKQFILNCPLKIGNVKFSQEDVVIPVGGVPLRVIRTYDSFERDKVGDFGFGWSYSIANMDIQLHEQRSDMAVFEKLYSSSTYYETESVRTGPNYDRNVSLTLPDGNRVTFLFYLEYNDGSLYDAQLPFYIARYQSPDGVTARLETLEEEHLSTMNVWKGQKTASGMSGTGVYSDPAYYEFSGYRLLTDDGTTYTFNRGDKGGDFFGEQAVWIEPKGAPYLSRIDTSTGEKIDLNVEENTLRIGQANDQAGVEHEINGAVTKVIKIDYDASGRIEKIWAPMDQGGSSPTICYEYDAVGNLRKVRKLTDRTAADPNDAYETLTYEYEDEMQRLSPTDHYITAIKDPRGVQPIRYEYDDAGRLIATIDAKGSRIAIDHDPAGRKETVYDRTDTAKENPTDYFYNARGNVTQVVKYVANVEQSKTLYAYGDPNNPDRPTSVTQYVPNPTDPEQMIDAVTSTSYINHTDAYEKPIKNKVACETVIDPAGNLTKTSYEPDGKVAAVVQGKNAQDINTYTELTASRNYYTDRDLLYLTGVTTTNPDDSLTWHSISLTYYDNRNRVECSVQIDTDALSFEDLFPGGHLLNMNEIDPAIHPMTRYGYDPNSSGSPDQPYWVQDATGAVQYFRYDLNNQQKASWTLRDDPSTTAVEAVRILNINETDAQGRNKRSIQITDDGSIPVVTILSDAEGYISANPQFEAVVQNQTFYNDIGKADFTIDSYGIVTKYEYDETGSLVETLVYENVAAFIANYQLYPTDLTGILTISRTLYDKEGRTIVAIGPYAPGDEPVGTETVYDAMGRVVKIRRWANVRIDLADLTSSDGTMVVGRKVPQGSLARNAWEGTVGGTLAWTANEGQPLVGSAAMLSCSRTEYDSAGRVWRTYSQDDAGVEVCTAEYVYDIAGRQIFTISLPGTDEEAVTETEYDGHRRSAVIDANGNKTEFVYDFLGRVITTVFPPTDIDGMDLPQDGNLEDDVTYSHVGYDGLGRKAWESAQTMQADPSVDDSTITDVNYQLRKKQFGYDAAGRLMWVQLPAVDDPEDASTDLVNPVYDYFYDDCGNMVGICDPKGRLTVFKYDAYGRQTHKYMPFLITAPIDREISFYAQIDLTGILCAETEYDALGRVAIELDYMEQAAGYFYDTFGRLEYKRFYEADAAPDGTNTNYPATFKEQIHYTYGNLSRVLTETVTDHTTTPSTAVYSAVYHYDAEGNIEKIETPQGEVGYHYNAITGQKQFTYTGTGGLSAPETLVGYGYDDLGRLKTAQTMYRNGNSVTGELTQYGYNAVGSRDWMKLPNEVYTRYTCNAMHRLADLVHYTSPPQEGQPLPSIVSRYNYALNANGMRSGVMEHVTQNRCLTYQYDNLNRLVREDSYDDAAMNPALNDGYTAQYTYDLVGNRKERVLTANGQTLTTAYTYDPDTDRLMTETHTGPIAAVPYGDGQRIFAYADGSGGMVWQLPGSNRRIGQFGAFVRGLPSVWNRAIFYVLMVLIPVVMLWPAAVRRWSRIKGGIDSLASSDLKLWHRMLCVLLAYIFLVGPEAFHRLAQAETQYSQLSTLAWGRGNRIIEYGYDANGSLTSKITTEGSTTVERVEYVYNLQNRLAGVTTTPYVDGQAQSPTLTEYRYNPQGIRVAKVETLGGTTIQTDYLIDPHNHTGYAQVLEETEYDISGSTAIPTSRIQYTLGDDVISQTQSITSDGGIGWTANPTQYLLYDGHGSTRQLVGMNQSIQQSYNYDGYGVLLQGASAESSPGVTPPQETSLLYAGEQFDTNSQMYNLRARYYNPSNGLFNRVDPYAGNLHDPQSLHKYLYCHANPVNNIDPTGMFSITTTMVVTAIRAVLFTMNAFGAAYHARGMAISGFSAYNRWVSGDFWNGLAYVVLSLVHGVGAVLNVLGMIAMSGPPPGGAVAAAFAGGGSMTVGGTWTVITSNPAVADWVLSSVAPAAYTAFIALMAKRAGMDGGSSGGSSASSQSHHKVPHENNTYEHHNHNLVKQAGWSQKDLEINPRNQMLLDNHAGPHSRPYHEAIRRMMDDAYKRVAGKGSGAAIRELNKIFDELEIGIKNGTYRPYNTKDVSVP